MKLVYINNNRPVTDSLTVAETFGKRHDHVLRDIRELECSDEFRISNFGETPYVHEQNGQEYHKYLITQDGFSFLVMGYTGKEAARFKEMYIGEFNRMRDELTKPQFKLPHTMVEAVESYLIELKRSEALEAEKQQLQLQNSYQEQQLASQEPKVAFANMVIAGGNTQPMGTVAKAVGIGRNNLFKFLREKGIMMRNSSLPYQTYIDRGYFIVREVPTKRGDDMIVNEATARVTAKGLEYIAKLVRENKGA
jgi:anti-repressor protein